MMRWPLQGRRSTGRGAGTGGPEPVGLRWWRRGRAPASWRTGPGQPHARFAARVAALRAQPRRLALAVTALVVVLAGMVYLVGFSPVLVARDVRIEGVSKTLRAQIRQQAQVPLGEPLARIDTGAVASRVSGIGRLEGVEVTRSWPSTIRIEADTKTPVLAVRNSQGQLEVADVSGELYAVVERVPPGVHRVEVTDGDAAPDRLRQAVAALEALPARLGERVDDLQVRGRETVAFTIGGAEVVWGSAAESQLKAQVLATLLKQEQPDEGDTVVIDVSAPRTPVVSSGTP